MQQRLQQLINLGRKELMQEYLKMWGNVLEIIFAC